MRSSTLSEPLAAPATVSSRLLFALIFLVMLAAYFPALNAGFIRDDQPGHVTRPELRSLAAAGRPEKSACHAAEAQRLAAGK